MKKVSRPLWILLLFLVLVELTYGGFATRFANLPQTLCYFLALLVALVVHEFAHAWAADHLGDPNPRLAGRLSLNPARHLDPVGTLLIVVTGYGWGRPVQFDPYNLRHPDEDGAWIAAAGPLANIILAVIAAVGLRLLPLVPLSLNLWLFTRLFCFTLVTINLSLAIFNLLPIYPLDGHHILRIFLPRDTRRSYDLFNRCVGTFLALILILPLFGGQSLVGVVTAPAFNFLANLLLP